VSSKDKKYSDSVIDLAYVKTIIAFVYIQSPLLVLIFRLALYKILLPLSLFIVLNTLFYCINKFEIYYILELMLASILMPMATITIWDFTCVLYFSFLVWCKSAVRSFYWESFLLKCKIVIFYVALIFRGTHVSTEPQVSANINSNSLSTMRVVWQWGLLPYFFSRT